MKYLNNTITGELIKLDKVSDNGIYYSIFENKPFKDELKFPVSARIENTIKSKMITEDYSGKSVLELESDIALECIIDSINSEGWLINEDSQNWYIKKGSTGADTLIRLTIPNHAYDSALKDKDNSNGQYYPLWQVISFGTENIDAKFSQITYNAIVIYLEELLPEHRQVIEMYASDGVVIEEKL